MATTESSTSPSGPSVAEQAAGLRSQIISRGEEVRTLRASGSEQDAAAAAVALQALLDLKVQYEKLTGEEDRTSTRKLKQEVSKASHEGN